MPNKEIENIWNSATDFIQGLKKNQQEFMQDSEEEIDIVGEACESIKKKYRFVTIEGTKDILFHIMVFTLLEKFL